MPTPDCKYSTRTYPNPFVQPKPAPIEISEWYFFGLKSSPIPTGAQLKFSLTFWTKVKVTHLVDNSQPDNFDSVQRAFLYWDKNSESIFRPTEATYKANRWRSTPSPIMACLVSVPWWRTAASRAFFRDSEVTICTDLSLELWRKHKFNKCFYQIIFEALVR